MALCAMAPRCAALVPRNACKHRIGTHAQRVCRSRLVALFSTNVCHTLRGISPCARLHAGFYLHASIYFCMRMPAQASYLRQLLCWRMCWRASSLAAENRIPLGTAGTVASEKKTGRPFAMPGAIKPLHGVLPASSAQRQGP